MQYDVAMKCISAELSRDLITLIFGERPVLKQISGSLPSTEHRADFLARVTGPPNDDDFIVHVEFQTAHDPNMPMRMLSYYARILYAHKLPVYPIVVYLSQKDAHIEATYNSSIGGRDVIAFKYEVVRIWELESAKIFESKLYGLYPLTPLMADSDLARCLQEVESAVRDKNMDVDSYTCTQIFAELKYPDEVVKAMMTDELLKKSTFYREARDEGIAVGMEKGRESGIRSVLSVRFGSVSARLSERIHSIMERNSSLFDDLIKLATTAKDVGEFERKLDQMM